MSSNNQSRPLTNPNKVRFRTYLLARYPVNQRDQLRAWGADDEYLLDYLDAQHIKLNKNLLIINDGFGALSVCLAQYEPKVVSDSFVSTLSIQNNLIANGIDKSLVTCIEPLSLATVNQQFDIVLIKVPRTLALLEYELMVLRNLVHEETIIIAAGMTKYIRSSFIDLFDQIIGKTTTSLAKKKARLIFSKFNASVSYVGQAYPMIYQLENTSYEIVNHAGVFSGSRLDIGTRFFLPHVPSTQSEGVIVDLGCGNGVVGVVAAERNPHKDIIFLDESYMAVASAEATFYKARQVNPNLNNDVRFMVGDCLSLLEPNSVDVILCNPPFHQQNAVTSSVAWRMFSQAKHCLRQGGELYVVGNRHLDYLVRLRRLFARVDIVDRNRKFVVYRVCKSEGASA